MCLCLKCVLYWLSQKAVWLSHSRAGWSMHSRPHHWRGNNCSAHFKDPPLIQILSLLTPVEGYKLKCLFIRGHSVHPLSRSWWKKKKKKTMVEREELHLTKAIYLSSVSGVVSLIWVLILDAVVTGLLCIMIQLCILHWRLLMRNKRKKQSRMTWCELHQPTLMILSVDSLCNEWQGTVKYELNMKYEFFLRPPPTTMQCFFV